MSEATFHKQFECIESVFSIGCRMHPLVGVSGVGKLTQTLPLTLRQLTHPMFYAIKEILTPRMEVQGCHPR
jgi:hypothetical protein